MTPAIPKLRLTTWLSAIALSLLPQAVGCGPSSEDGRASGAAGGGIITSAGTSGMGEPVGVASGGAGAGGLDGNAGSEVAGGSGAGSTSAGSGGASSGAGGTASLGGSSGMPGVAGKGGAPGSGGGAGTGAGGSGGVAGVLGATPPMGWNSWNTFQCNLDEALIKQTADSLVSSGMQAAGYQYVNLDDCWMDGRDSNGKLRWNATKFPSGIPALAEYVHGKGLKLGIYEVPNTATCVGIYGGTSKTVAVGSLGHETSDAQTFASWGIDYLKYDKCQGPISAFATMRDALLATGRPIFYSINPGDGGGCPPNSCSIKLGTIANMWRIGFDIAGNWTSMTGLIDQDANLFSYAGPGHWNDPDMMEVGNGLTDTEGRSHFSMWAMLAAPLIAGNDLRSMSAATKTTLTNTEVIAVDQDPLGSQGRLVATIGNNLQVWSKTLSGTATRALALFNRSGATASITVQWAAIGIGPSSVSVRDLWAHADRGMFTGSYTAQDIPSHGVVMLKVTSAQ